MPNPYFRGRYLYGLGATRLASTPLRLENLAKIPAFPQGQGTTSHSFSYTENRIWLGIAIGMTRKVSPNLSGNNLPVSRQMGNFYQGCALPLSYCGTASHENTIGRPISCSDKLTYSIQNCKPFSQPQDICLIV